MCQGVDIHQVCYFSQQPFKLRSVIPLLKMRKLRLREVKQVSPDHKAEWATELGSSNPELWEPSQKHLPYVELMFISGGL